MKINLEATATTQNDTPEQRRVRLSSAIDHYRNLDSRAQENSRNIKAGNVKGLLLGATIAGAVALTINNGYKSSSNDVASDVIMGQNSASSLIVQPNTRQSYDNKSGAPTKKEVGRLYSISINGVKQEVLVESLVGRLNSNKNKNQLIILKNTKTAERYFGVLRTGSTLSEKDSFYLLEASKFIDLFGAKAFVNEDDCSVYIIPNEISSLNLPDSGPVSGSVDEKLIQYQNELKERGYDINRYELNVISRENRGTGLEFKTFKRIAKPKEEARKEYKKTITTPATAPQLTKEEITKLNDGDNSPRAITPANRSITTQPQNQLQNITNQPQQPTITQPVITTQPIYNTWPQTYNNQPYRPRIILNGQNETQIYNLVNIQNTARLSLAATVPINYTINGVTYSAPMSTMVPIVGASIINPNSHTY